MGLTHRSVRASAVVVTGLAMAAAMAAFGASDAAAAAPAATPRMVTIPDSVNPTTDTVTGAYSSSKMAVEVALAPQHQSELSNLLEAVYSSGSSEYHHWLAKGTFDARFAPSAAEHAAVASYLRSSGLTVTTSGSPFLVRAVGSSAKVSAAFDTTLSTYRDPRGVSYFSNSTPIKMPSTVAHGVYGVVGLSNTVREHSQVTRINNTMRPDAKSAGTSSGASASCETGYVTTEELFAYVNNGTGFPYGYGGGPGCSGLTPSQTNSIYSAPHLGPRGKGAGVNVAVFELSAYQRSDIDTWAHQFYGPNYTPPLRNINVDGGPLHPVCPAGDTCPPEYNGYAGDIEVDADIEMSLSIAPDAQHILVYNAPNDYTGQTELAEYAKIANQDIADTVSSSWAVCENDVNAAYAEAENVVFEQMALQGQSMFGAEGDTGAFECIRSDGTTIVNVLDPPSQPWVTSVGGTSLESDNPGTNPHPRYPRGVETVWNVDSLCSNGPASPANDNEGGLFWCAATGAGGGGSSQWWGRPFYQRGPGVNNPYTTYANGTTQCALAAAGTPCREDPDISANADEYTPYAEYCTGNASTPYSACATFSSEEVPPGWFGIGGTSLSSPLWAAIFADRDSFQGHRSGNANPLLYTLFNLDPRRFFHDITGIGQTTTNNGLFPVTPGYDEATGIGTPKMAAIITVR
jgi:subtilase family serine protease